MAKLVTEGDQIKGGVDFNAAGELREALQTTLMSKLVERYQQVHQEQEEQKAAAPAAAATSV